MIRFIAHFCGEVSLRGAGSRVNKSRPDIYFRGYLTNRVELAAQTGLERSCDCLIELLTRCYQQWRRDLPARLEGQFALVISDSARGELLITRDALGVVPLYWELRASSVRFASRLRDLVDSESRGDLNLKEVERYLLFGTAASQRTCYASINRLPPGSCVWVKDGKLVRDTYWDPRSFRDFTYKNARDYVERFMELVAQSVKGALADTSSPWIALSGGLDSNTILHPALACYPDLQAYSIVAPDWRQEDESKWIQRIVKQRGIRWTPISVDEVLPFNDLPGEFCGSPDAVVLYGDLYQRLNALINGDVLLTGDGGDSFMGAQMGAVPVHLADALFNGDFSGAPQPLRQWMQQSVPRRSTLYWLAHAIFLPTIRHLLRRSVRPPHHHLHPVWLTARKHWRPRAVRSMHPSAVAPHCRIPSQQAILDDLWQCTEDTTSVDKTYSNRHPLFNRPLFEFLWSIPWSQKQLPLCDRYLQRRALKGIVDDDIRTRISYGIGTRTFVAGLRQSRLWQDYLSDEPLIAEHGFVDANRWRAAIQQACVGQTHAEPMLFRAITVEVWLKQLREQHQRSRLSCTDPLSGLM